MVKKAGLDCGKEIMIFSDNAESYASVNRRKIDLTFKRMNINGHTGQRIKNK
jgi:hypothetical protein